MKRETKGSLVLAALRKAALASDATITDASPQSFADALDDLELMMAEWQTGNKDAGIDLGFQFSKEGVAPLPDDRHGLPDFALHAVILTLTTRILSDYGREPSAILLTKAAYGKEQVIKSLSSERMPRLTYPARMPIGSGNHFKQGHYFKGARDNGK